MTVVICINIFDFVVMVVVVSSVFFLSGGGRSYGRARLSGSRPNHRAGIYIKNYLGMPAPPTGAGGGGTTVTAPITSC
jgi:hypothetical protein